MHVNRRFNRPTGELPVESANRESPNQSGGLTGEAFGRVWRVLFCIFEIVLIFLNHVLSIKLSSVNALHDLVLQIEIYSPGNTCAFEKYISLTLFTDPSA